jgi:hypothetical protein
MIKMDLHLENIRLIHRDQRLGYRKLEPNEFRESNIACAPDELMRVVLDKIMPEFEWHVEAPRHGKEYTESNGVYKVPHVIGTSVSGTNVHKLFESGLGTMVLNQEEKVTRERDGIIRTGHVDREYIDKKYGRVISDVKSTNEGVIYSISRGPKPGGYTEKKVKHAISQGNSYATAKGVKYFNIMYVSRDNLMFYIDWYEQSDIEDNRIWEALKVVLEHVENGTLPDTCDGMCDLPRNTHYCRHHHEYPGVDKSDANCPGRLALAEARENRKPETG